MGKTTRAWGEGLFVSSTCCSCSKVKQLGLNATENDTLRSHDCMYNTGWILDVLENLPPLWSFQLSAVPRSGQSLHCMVRRLK